MPPRKKREVKQEDKVVIPPERKSARAAAKPKPDYKEKQVLAKEFVISSSSESESESEASGLDETKTEDKVKKEAVKKVKKQVIRKRKFKKGKWNPDIELLKYSVFKDQPGRELKKDDSVRMTNLNAIRAVFTNDLALMEKVFFDREAVSTLNAVWSPDIELTALDYLALRNQPKMI